MQEECAIHEMKWCAICNGDAKKFEKSEEEPTFQGLLKDSQPRSK